MTTPHKRRVLDADIPFDPYCQIIEYETSGMSDDKLAFCKQFDLVPIFDAETDLVALVPRKYSAELLEIINRFEPDHLTDADWKILDSGGNLSQIDRTTWPGKQP